MEASLLDGICQIIDMPPFSQQEVRTFIKTRLRSTGIDFTLMQRWVREIVMPRTMV